MENNQTIHLINIDNIIPNRFQPRLTFDEQGINELASSIKEHGIIQPLVLRQLGEKYEIIAGERRYKASVLAGLTEVPAIISNLDDNKSAEVALVENVQRRNLSSVEEAKSYKKILDKGYLTQENLAKKIGVTQSTIANKLRLLNLSDAVQEALLNERISERHARSLLQISDSTEQNNMLNKIINERLTVRQLDSAIKEKYSHNENSSENLVENFSETLVNPFSQTTNNESNLEEITSLESLEPVQNIETISSLENIFNQPSIIENNISNNDNIENVETNEMIETLDFGMNENNPTEIEPVDTNIKTSKLLNIFDKPAFPSLEDEKVNLSFEFSSENIFDKNLNIEPEAEEFTNLVEPEIEQSQKDMPNKDNIITEEPKSRIIEGDLNSVTKALKELESEIRDAKFKVVTEEFDFEDLYQIIIKIDKQV